MKLGERQSLKEIYMRWTSVIVIFAVISALAIFRYNREVAAMPLEVFLRNKPDGMTRVLGRVAAGTLARTASVVTADVVTSFKLEGDKKQTEISVQYIGKPDNNLRELKILVLAGFFDPDKMAFIAHRIAPIPNIGFVIAAYLFSIVPLILFLFCMERNLILLSILIKEERPYQPEEGITPSP